MVLGPEFGEEQLLTIVDNQVADNHPPAVKETLMRLQLSGIPQEDARRYIACALMVELQYITHHDEAVFSIERYQQYLSTLPEMPWLPEED